MEELVIPKQDHLISGGSLMDTSYQRNERVMRDSYDNWLYEQEDSYHGYDDDEEYAGMEDCFKPILASIWNAYPKLKEK